MRFVMLGGFLGAGKTTTIAGLAERYRRQGLRIGIVTNDQAADLVDTHNLRSQGFDVGEVAGACFCCNFNELTDTVKRLSADETPDVVLAEPVGSCTDLVATVVQPLKQLCQDQFDVAPYGVILKPSHGLRILGGKGKAGFSPKAAYIFKKQLEEADYVIVNRIDELAAETIEELTELVSSNFQTPVVKISAKTGQGMDSLLEVIDQTGEFGRRLLELDYDIYAEGEAELGWLNCSLQLSAADAWDLDQVLMAIVQDLKKRLSVLAAETAHLKVIGMADGGHGVANLVSSDSDAELSLPSDCQVRSGEVIVNARVATDPELLQREVVAGLKQVAEQFGLTASLRPVQSFRPGRPVPTHRFDADSVL